MRHLQINKDGKADARPGDSGLPCLMKPKGVLAKVFLLAEVWCCHSSSSQVQNPHQPFGPALSGGHGYQPAVSNRLNH
jgi:hypothetical protein